MSSQNEPPSRTWPRYSLAELLSRCDPDAPVTEDERDWLDTPPTGAELV
jgi:antitoxin ChpS